MILPPNRRIIVNHPRYCSGIKPHPVIRLSIINLPGNHRRVPRGVGCRFSGRLHTETLSLLSYIQTHT